MLAEVHTSTSTVYVTTFFLISYGINVSVYGSQCYRTVSYCVKSLYDHWTIRVIYLPYEIRSNEIQTTKLSDVKLIFARKLCAPAPSDSKIPRLFFRFQAINSLNGHHEGKLPWNRSIDTPQAPGIDPLTHLPGGQKRKADALRVW